MLKNLRALAGALCLAVVCAVSSPASAAQGSGCLPTTGTYTGVAYAGLMNSAIAALISTNSGATQPKTDCSNAMVAGQQWYDTSIATPAWRIFDGNTPLLIGFLDPTNHIWQPQVGGGLASVASAATTDLCSVAATYIGITGSTTISSFGTSCAVGQIKVANFGSVLALQYGSSSILLPTAANITTQPGDQAVMLYTGGGIWRAVSYLRADGTALTSTTVPPVHFAGETISMRGTTCPAGSLAEDGSAISRTTYAALFSYLGSTWGAGDGSTTFNLPNSGGQFDRGWISGQSVDSGRTFGSTEADTVGPHTHGVTAVPSISASVSNAGNGCCGVPGTGGSPLTTNTQTPIATETRPKNITVLRCIFIANSP